MILDYSSRLNILLCRSKRSITHPVGFNHSLRPLNTLCYFS